MYVAIATANKNPLQIQAPKSDLKVGSTEAHEMITLAEKVLNVFGGIKDIRGWHVSQSQDTSDDTQKCRNVHFNFFLNIKFGSFGMIPECIS